MRPRILSHWFGWYHADRDIGFDAREALSRGCTHGIEHRGQLVTVLLPGAPVGNVAPEIENDDGEPVAVDDCDYCGDDGYTDHDEETEDGGCVATTAAENAAGQRQPLRRSSTALWRT